MLRNRAAPDPVLSEVVRERLATLLAEVPARRAIAPAPGYEDGDEEPAPVEAGPEVRRGSSGSGAEEERAEVRGRGPRSVPEWGRAVWEFTRSHLLAVGVVLLTGCLWAGYNVLQARSSPVTAPPSAAPTLAASPVPSPASTPSAVRVLVHVLGAVARPGVVSLPEGARVLDAIEAAGGLTADADPGELNLAALVVDGSQVVIGERGKPRGELRTAAGGETGGTQPAGGGKLSLNTASQAQLETLPGVGPVTASKIVAWREQHGKFTRVEELQEIDGIGPKTYAQLEPHVGL